MCWKLVASIGVISLMLLSGHKAWADTGLGGFGYINAGPTAEAPPPRPKRTKQKHTITTSVLSPANAPWGPVPTKLVSIVNVAPVLLPYFNNGPVFGVPGTTTGDFWNRTQVTGDWGGARTRLANMGVFLDVYTTSVYQDVTSGGLKTGGSFVQNIQTSLNVDTGRANLWSGGLLHVTVQSRYGDSPANTFTAGSTIPQYTGLVYPGPSLWHDTLPTEYFLVQSITQQWSVILGKISTVFIPDETLFGDSYKYYFANFNFNKNPQTTNFYTSNSWAALAAYALTPKFIVAGGVLDPNTSADNFATEAFDRVNLYLTAVDSYDIAGLPGQFSPAFNWSNKPKVDLSNPFGPLTSVPQVSQAVGGLLGANPLNGLPANFRSDSWFAIANVSQYLYVKDDPAVIGEKLKSGQPLNGIGIFARAGYAPPDTNPITQDYSAALVAHGLVDARSYDSFGVGYYYNVVSSDFKSAITNLTLGHSNASNERGFEAFYDFAITPAVRLIPSYQHIWNPLAAQVSTGTTHADVFLTRLTVAW
jgi:porin